MTKILNFALKIKGGGREGGTCEVLRPCHPPPPQNFERALRGQELEFFTSYLSERIQCCNFNGKTSSYRKITCGVPQGFMLGLLLFILYMPLFPMSRLECTQMIQIWVKK